MDSMGDVLLAGPAVRAVAHGAERVVLLAGPRGADAAALLPGVDRVVTWCAPWIDPAPPPVERGDVDRLVRVLAGVGADRAVVLTSFHQSPLPLALLLRMAGVPWIGAVSDDYPGSLLDLRHRVATAVPEHERALSLAAAAGYPRPPGDRGLPAVRRPLPDTRHLTGPDGYVAVHVGADAPAREIPELLATDTVAALTARGDRVVVTGAAHEEARAKAVAAGTGTSVAGRTSTAELADVLDRARVLVSGNTGPAHLAAAVGTPVVSLFSPVVPASAWAPQGVRVRVLGDQEAPCAGSRARVCPVPGHPCLTSVTTDDVLAAVDALLDEEER
ncbi:glycosyltransferase family 9 protein [Nocardiopsis sp. NRRL B-16309]|uniref:glycosyltransferase family 9 protein n=1 Tax=Nocardiopsis sp. NRRL B-16309 TaxID=1519494 RepID=UPI0006ADAC95|nr:glycosyltransferase family 9 protein [Nocardiopsis sp. NRRL B-16309]KOX18337.1 glycosyl transferase [Nocardiopsis sp. NRRL B-16309]